MTGENLNWGFRFFENVLRNVSWINPKGPHFLDQKRKLGLANQVLGREISSN
ncbi:hypothetical protein P872_20315 [Rhodonellum psychrophilum GCM71 = DSM 17998]|uniref:Uncharacterized protein n=1 Tax=Rhodonellum psychrophilum GCM71 = DSM 17998 TaxID=1123057 RepID=U5BUH2_9BACT|nr:hypothetical protein P872_20315 [Rhodonellum psychrophilum GCM71 = DSM 17998]